MTRLAASSSPHRAMTSRLVLLAVVAVLCLMAPQASAQVGTTRDGHDKPKPPSPKPPSPKPPSPKPPSPKPPSPKPPSPKPPSPKPPSPKPPSPKPPSPKPPSPKPPSPKPPSPKPPSPKPPSQPLAPQKAKVIEKVKVKGKAKGKKFLKSKKLEYIISGSKVGYKEADEFCKSEGYILVSLANEGISETAYSICYLDGKSCWLWDEKPGSCPYLDASGDGDTYVDDCKAKNYALCFGFKKGIP
ncbi:hypothetical protein VOLCADRAFT_90114 [Volvox carteri f. nagariensis]|uniref:C-type lectin domain-containing protein n=1 Tax=Volvox carteri f. nagariensis TaxID=3068 RepID=D8TTI5_VOLCA|nr:uncharacterized protein VOLCADRAFT_90114 [Volvox carteri f. nagariensis]EFJ49312.1 hypothetical protein VOLCADRAFT_90114 [Volvox carteri f. nagariensis]|eukprot:XP_002949760.1 hypothetical protein VOLCADRAFT_90114 [Volvox carteri f. nagariensis]